MQQLPVQGRRLSAAITVAARKAMCHAPCLDVSFPRTRKRLPRAVDAGAVAACWTRPKRPAQTSASPFRGAAALLARGAPGVAACRLDSCA
eukprot:12326970-Alexandrium_andersonii.AAC.1